MGRIITKDRERKNRKTKNKIVIALEGENKTEKLYFENFDDRNKPYTISIAKGNATDPYSLTKSLVSEIKRRALDIENGDMAFAVFDTDTNPSKNKIINDALNLAKANKIKLITSSPCVELWFLLHYEYTTAYLTSEEVIKRLKKYCKGYKKKINIYEFINDNVENAILRAKKLEKYQLSNDRKIGFVECNPNTEMYKIVECLL